MYWEFAKEGQSSELLPLFRNDKNRTECLSTFVEGSLSICPFTCASFHRPWDIDIWLKYGQLWSGENVNVCFMVHLLDIQIHLQLAE